MNRLGRRDAAALGLLLALATAACAPSLVGAYYFNDWEYQNLPERAFFGRGLALGELRWWAPELGGGYPLFAEGQAGAAYPPNLIFALLPAWLALSWSVILHLALAGAGVYACLRLDGVRRLAAVAGGAVYLLSGPVFGRAVHVNFLNGLAWLPVVLWSLESIRRGRTRAGLLLAAAIGLQLLAGHAHPPLLAGLLTCGWLTQPQAGRCRGVVVGAWLLGLALAGVQLLPQLELAPLSHRAGELSVAQRTVLSLAPEHLGTLFAPTLHGTPYVGDLDLKRRYGLELQWEWLPYVGVLPLFLVGLSPWLRRRERWLYFGLALAALLLAMGRTLPFYGWLSSLPGWSAIRGPARLLGLFALGAAMLCGLALDELARDGLPRRGRLPALGLLGVAGVVTVGAALLFGQMPLSDTHAAFLVPGLARLLVLLAATALLLLRRDRWRADRWLPAATLVVALDLVAAGFGYHPTVPPAHYRPPVELALARRRSGERLIAPWSTAGPWAANRHLLYEGVHNLAAYTPLALRQWDGPWRDLAARPTDSPWLRRLRVHAVSAAWLGQPGDMLVPLTQPPGPIAWSPQAEGVVAVSVTRHRVVLATANSGPAEIVVSQTGYPGWRVVTRQGERPAMLAEGVLLGGRVSGAESRLTFIYRPLSIRLGLFVSLLAAAALVAGWVRDRP